MTSLPEALDPLGLWPRARGAGAAGADAAARAGVALLDRALRSPRAAEAVDAVLGSALAERAVRTACEGPLVDAAVRAAIRSGAIDRLARELAASGAADRLVEQALDSPRTAALLDRVLQGPAAERLVAAVLDSRLADATVARVLASDELWLVVDEIARSPSVTEAIAHQGAGFADQVAGEVGRRSRRADDRLERVARRLLHRGPRPGAAPTLDPPGPR